MSQNVVGGSSIEDLNNIDSDIIKMTDSSHGGGKNEMTQESTKSNKILTGGKDKIDIKNVSIEILLLIATHLLFSLDIIKNFIGKYIYNISESFVGMILNSVLFAITYFLLRMLLFNVIY